MIMHSNAWAMGLLAASWMAPVSVNAVDIFPASRSPFEGMINTEDLPQFITITLDGSINSASAATLKPLMDIRDSQGCGIKSTFYTSIEEGSTKCDIVRGLHKGKHEIAAASTENPNMEQIMETKDYLVDICGIPREDIKGFRAPFLQYSQETLEHLKKLGFLYDSSIAPSDFSDSKYGKEHIWPFTFDQESLDIFQCDQCDQSPLKPNQGFWEVPMWKIFNEDNSLNDSMDYSGDVYSLFQDNFERRYHGNRAPMGLYFHASWLENNAQTFKKWIQAVLDQHNDVFFVTTSELIEWMKNPMPKTHYQNSCAGQIADCVPPSDCLHGQFSSDSCQCECALPFCRDEEGVCSSSTNCHNSEDAHVSRRAAISPDQCCPEGFTGFRSYSSCTQYYQCAFGQVVPNSVGGCASGLVFDGATCNWPSQARTCQVDLCGTNTDSPTDAPIIAPTGSPTIPPTERPTERPDQCCPSGFTGQRAYDDCKQFYECLSGSVFPNSQRACPEGLFFDGVACEWPDSDKPCVVDSCLPPTESPTEAPIIPPTGSPTLTVTSTPTRTPTATPTRPPIDPPTGTPTGQPTAVPTESPTVTDKCCPVGYTGFRPYDGCKQFYECLLGTVFPDSVRACPNRLLFDGENCEWPDSEKPCVVDSCGAETETPTETPIAPTGSPSVMPTVLPTLKPTIAPSKLPTGAPTASPTKPPTDPPSKQPTESPTTSPTDPPTDPPTRFPTGAPTAAPTKPPTDPPSKQPTGSPSVMPTKLPTGAPTASPTDPPTDPPTRFPTKAPSATPTKLPSEAPTASPTKPPTDPPTRFPTKTPSAMPTKLPTIAPTKLPTEAPSAVPTKSPTGSPTSGDSEAPTMAPTGPDQCCPSGFTGLRAYDDCKQFYQCSFGQVIPGSTTLCPPGLLFDGNTCDWPDADRACRVDVCGNGSNSPTTAPIAPTGSPTAIPTATPTVTPDQCCPSGFTGIRAYGDCTQFYQCSSGEVVLDSINSCPVGLLFNGTTCDWPSPSQPCEIASCRAGIDGPTAAPIATTGSPTVVPTAKPIAAPTATPTKPSTDPPTKMPTKIPTKLPTRAPTVKPTIDDDEEKSDQCCPNGLTGLRAFDDCKKFYECFSGEVFPDSIRACPAGLLFDGVECNWPNADKPCEVDSCLPPTDSPTAAPVAPTQSPTIPEFTDQCCPSGFTGLRAYDDCKKFYQCISGRVVSDSIITCTAGLVFDGVGSCDWPNPDRTCQVDSCGTGPGTPTTTPIAPTKSPTVALTAAPIPAPTAAPSEEIVSLCCPDNFTGWRSSSNDCTEYYQCSFGTILSEPAPCGAGLLFDDRVQTCNWESLVQCTHVPC